MAVSFSTATTFAATSVPRAITVGNFTNDDRVDLVVLNRNDGTVSLLPGDGSGGFGPEQRINISTDPVSITGYDLVSEDLNGDGFLDLAIAHIQGNFFSPSGVTVLLNNQDGGFTTPQYYETGRLPNDLAVGDVNGDNIADLVVVNLGDSTISILLGTGTGVLEPPQTISTISNAATIALADFNEDNRPEILVLSNDGSVGSVLLNTEMGFEAQPSFTAPNSTSEFALGDFNEDGLPDLARVDFFDNTLIILLNNGDLGFEPAQLLPTNRELETQLVTADLDRDGHLDLLVPSRQDFFSNLEITVFLGDGTGGFSLQPATFSLPFDLLTLTLADINSDERLDLISGGFGDFSSSVDQLAIAINNLGLDIQPVIPALQDGGTDAPATNLTLTFNEPVQGFDRTDLVLTRDGATLSLDTASLTTTDGGRTWILGNLEALTRPDGVYTLSLPATGTGIQDGANNLLSVTSAPVSWRRGTMATLPSAINFSGGQPGRRIVGNARNERITGTLNNDRINGLGGSDRVRGLNGNDFISGDNGNDVLFGNGGNDRLLGDVGNDVLNGGNGRDRLLGGDGRDQLAGASGQDVLIGGLGRDTLIGGGGIDVFHYASLEERGDLILDFSTEDIIDLSEAFQAEPFRQGSGLVRFDSYVRLAQVGSSAEVRIDADGAGVRRAFVTLATLLNTQADQLGAKNFVA